MRKCYACNKPILMSAYGQIYTKDGLRVGEACSQKCEHSCHRKGYKTTQVYR